MRVVYTFLCWMRSFCINLQLDLQVHLVCRRITFAQHMNDAVVTVIVAASPNRMLYRT